VFKQLAGLGALLKQARNLAERMKEIHEQLRSQRAVGSAGGGMVEVEVNGLSEVLDCRIDPQLVEQNDREMIEELVAAAANQAIAKAKKLHVEALRSLTGGIDLPGFDAVAGDFVGPVDGPEGTQDGGVSGDDPTGGE